MPASYRLEILCVLIFFAVVVGFISETAFTTIDCLMNRVMGKENSFCVAQLRESLTFYTPPVHKEGLVEIRANDAAAIAGTRVEAFDGYIQSSVVETDKLTPSDARRTTEAVAGAEAVTDESATEGSEGEPSAESADSGHAASTDAEIEEDRSASAPYDFVTAHAAADH